MTFRSKFPSQLYQKYFLAKDTLEAFLSKLEVISDSTTILYSIRILIVVLAFLMTYIQTPNEKTDVSNVREIELLDSIDNPDFENLN
jgi:hypothetical protein